MSRSEAFWVTVVVAIIGLIWWFGPERGYEIASRKCDGAERLGLVVEMQRYSHWSYQCMATIDGRVMTVEDALKWSQRQVNVDVETGR